MQLLRTERAHQRADRAHQREERREKLRELLGPDAMDGLVIAPRVPSRHGSPGLTEFVMVDAGSVRRPLHRPRRHRRDDVLSHGLHLRYGATKDLM